MANNDHSNQQSKMFSFSDSNTSNQEQEPESKISTSSLKPKQCSLFPCFKNYLKRKFFDSSEKLESEESFFSPSNPYVQCERMNHQTIPSTIASAGVIAVALCDSPDPADADFIQQPANPWILKPLVQDPPAPDQTPNLSSFFETYIRANLELEKPNAIEEKKLFSTSLLTPPSGTPCKVSGLVNKIISTVFTPEQVQHSKSSPNSAICQLLATPSPQESEKRIASNFSSNTDCYLNFGHIPDKVYHQLIEFEFNYEPIVRKFALASDDFLQSRNALNSLEAARISELTTVLAPLNVCLSSQYPEMSAARENLVHFMSGSTEVADFQRETLLIITHHSFNLLIALAKQLESFASFNSLNQKTLLRNSVMEIMLLRSIMVRPLTSSSCESGQTALSTMSLHANYCTSHVPFTEETNENGDNGEDDDQIKSDESSIRAILETDEEQQMAMLYAKQFRDGYRKLSSTIDAEWKADRTIFYLVSAMILTSFDFILTDCFIF